MNSINKYQDFLYEFNRKDIAILKSSDMAKYFTIAYEFELETEDVIGLEKDMEFDEEVLDIVLKDTINEMGLKGKDFKKARDFVEGVNMFIEDDMSDSDLEGDDIEKIILKYCDPSIYPDEDFNGVKTKDILDFMKKMFVSFYKKENLDYLIKKVKLHLPKFYKKWNSQLDYLLDVTLERGIEFKPKTYLVGLDTSIEILNDFFEEYKKQDYWIFNERTGLHINIGVNDKNAVWNPLKGLVILNDMSEREVPFTFKDMTWRMNNAYTRSLKGRIIDLFKNPEVKKRFDLDIHDIAKVEKELNPYLVKAIKDYSVKSIGFNLIHLKKFHYVEFRYVGGVIDKDLVIDKTLYFCYIVYLMTTDYKQQDYHKKLYKFLEELKNEK